MLASTSLDLTKTTNSNKATTVKINYGKTF